jgi:hypothetical protein
MWPLFLSRANKIGGTLSSSSITSTTGSSTTSSAKDDDIDTITGNGNTTPPSTLFHFLCEIPNIIAEDYM